MTHRRVLDAVLDGEKLSVFMTQVDEMPKKMEAFTPDILYPITCPDVISVKPEAPLKAELSIRIAGSTSSAPRLDSVLDPIDDENRSDGSVGAMVDSGFHESDRNGETDDTNGA